MSLGESSTYFSLGCCITDVALRFNTLSCENTQVRRKFALFLATQLTSFFQYVLHTFLLRNLTTSEPKHSFVYFFSVHYFCFVFNFRFLVFFVYKFWYFLCGFQLWLSQRIEWRNNGTSGEKCVEQHWKSQWAKSAGWKPGGRRGDHPSIATVTEQVFDFEKVQWRSTEQWQPPGPTGFNTEV